MAKFHLKDDGTAGPCKAQEGNCPKKGAIHGDSIEDVYRQLEQVMEDQQFYAKVGDVYDRPDAFEVGHGGMMMHYTDPQMIRIQVEAMRKIGLKDEAVRVLEKYQPVLAAAEGNDQGDKVDYNDFMEKSREYSYGDGFIGQTYTWVAKAHYDIQTVALHSLMDRLEEGSLDDIDMEAYRVALGDTGVKLGDGKPQTNAFLAFNYNPYRQPENFWLKAAARLKREGFSREVHGDRHTYKVPAYFWKGLPEDARERFAVSVLKSSYDPIRARGNVITNFLTSRDFGESLSSVFANQKDLSSYVAPIQDRNDVRVATIHSDRVAKGRLELTDDGFLWHERDLVTVERQR